MPLIPSNTLQNPDHHRWSVSSVSRSLAVGMMFCGTLVAAASATHRTSRRSAHVSVKHKMRKSTHSSLRHTDSTAIAAERATQIQTALIQKGYLSGEPSGNWDAATVAAMQKLQSDNGWQHKVTPDARALIKLGLGAAPLEPSASAISPQPPR